MDGKVIVYIVCSGHCAEADEVFHQIFLDPNEAQEAVNIAKAENDIHQDEVWDEDGENFVYLEVHSVKVPDALRQLIRIET